MVSALAPNSVAELNISRCTCFTFKLKNSNALKISFARARICTSGYLLRTIFATFNASSYSAILKISIRAFFIPAFSSTCGRVTSPKKSLNPYLLNTSTLLGLLSIIVTLKLLANNILPITKPKRPKPAIITGFSCSSISSYSNLFCHLAKIGLIALSLKINNRGEITIESVTTKSRSPAVLSSKSWFCFEKEIKTKANSLDCASRNANRNSYPFFNRKSLPKISKIVNFRTISNITKPSIWNGFSIKTKKFILAPTDIKNRPSSNPLNGSMVVSSS